jgi:hypothetical protein
VTFSSAINEHGLQGEHVQNIAKGDSGRAEAVMGEQGETREIQRWNLKVKTIVLSLLSLRTSTSIPPQPRTQITSLAESR